MDLCHLLATYYPPALGMKGSMTTIADLARYKRMGFLTGQSLRSHVTLVCTARMESANNHGHGNRWRRRFTARMDAEILRLKAIQPTAKQAACDAVHDTATEGFARRPFRTNPHD